MLLWVCISAVLVFASYAAETASQSRRRRLVSEDVASSTVATVEDFEWLEDQRAGFSYVGPLLYRASRDGFDVSAFHAKVDNKGPTVTVVKSTNGYIFGGYADKSWRSSGSYQTSTESWLFQLTGGGRARERLPLRGSHNQYALHFRTDYGPTFGGGHDLKIMSACNANTISYSTLGHTYTKAVGGQYVSFTAASSSRGYFQCADWEVYSVKWVTAAPTVAPTTAPTAAPTLIPTLAPILSHCDLHGTDVRACEADVGCELNSEGGCIATTKNDCAAMTLDECDLSGKCYVDTLHSLCIPSTPSPTTQRRDDGCGALVDDLYICWMTDGCEPKYGAQGNQCVPTEKNDCVGLDIGKCLSSEKCWFDFDSGFCHMVTEDVTWQDLGFNCFAYSKKVCNKPHNKTACMWDKKSKKCEGTGTSDEIECGYRTKIIMDKRNLRKINSLIAASPCQCQELCTDNNYKHWRFNIRKRLCECVTAPVNFSTMVVRNTHYFSSGKL